MSKANEETTTRRLIEIDDRLYAEVAKEAILQKTINSKIIHEALDFYFKNKDRV